ncbi:MAG: T9SS type A sorting domain-containing protein [Flavobacteriales bacterium]|nr:T9SS type A sorting domain-containing protein [Flavobacteriales bacterium]
MNTGWGQGIIYQHSFGTTTISGKPYNVAPDTFNPNLSNSSWTTSASGFTSLAGSSGQALSLSNSSGNPTYTLTFDIESGYKLNVNQFSFWRQRSTTGAQNWSMTINGTNVGSGTVPTTGANIGSTNVSNTISDVTGTVTIVMTLSGATGAGTFRLDDFTLIGTLESLASNIISTGLVTDAPFCVDATNTASGTVAYTSTGTYNGTFTAELSDASGGFTSPIAIGTGTSPINITIPANTPSGNGYRIRVVNDDPNTVGSNSDAFTIINGVPLVTSYVATPQNQAMILNWVNPAGCFDEILIVAKANASINGTPTGAENAYLFFGNGDAFDGGFVVYKGLANPQTISNLANGTTYYFKLFVRKGSEWSAGQEVTGVPFTVSAASDYFRSKQSGNWNDIATWESSSDNVSWINATLTPTFNANSISVLNSHEVTITASVTIDQVVIHNGAILNIASTTTINEGLGNDIIVNDGGRVNYRVSTISYNSGATILIETGGVLGAESSGITGAGTGVNSSAHLYQDAAILEWNPATSLTPSSSNVVFFPNVTTEIPIFRLNQNIASWGASTPTTINGILELNDNISLGFSSSGQKNIKYGIRSNGNATVTATSTAVFNFSGDNVVIGSTTGELTIDNSNGLVFDVNSQVNLQGQTNLGDGTSATITNGLIFNNAVLNLGDNAIITTNSLTSNTGTLTGTGNLIVLNELNLLNGEFQTNNLLRLRSNTINTARVAPVGVGASITGNVVVERHIPAKRAWRFLTAPVTGNTNNSVYFNWQNNGAAGNNGTGVNLWSPAGGNGLVAGGGSPNIYKYKTVAPAGWDAITNTQTEALFTNTTNNAFMVFVTGGANTTNIAAGATATTMIATGALRVGDVNYGNLPANIHTLIGNPYASPISPLAVLNGNPGFRDKLWVLDPQIGSVGQYVIYDKVAGYTNISGSYQAGTNIQSGQAFFVRRSSLPENTAATFTITEAHKATVSDNGVFDRNATQSITIDKLRLSLWKNQSEQAQNLDAVLAVFYDNGNNAVDMADGGKINGVGENLALMNGTSAFTLEHRATAIPQDVLPVRVSGMQEGANYQLRVQTEGFNNPNVEVFLHDTFTNTVTPIPTDDTVVTYPFTVTSATASTGNRFQVVFQNSPLGVSNPEGFSQAVVYPNPVNDGMLHIALPTATYQKVSLYNALGQVVYQQNALGTTNLLQVSTQGLANGYYQLQVEDQQGQKYQAKVIINQ